MTKTELVAEIGRHVNFSQAVVKDIVNAFCDVVEDQLCLGEDIIIQGFGSFKRVITKERNGVNPKTGEKIKIKSKKKVSFKAGKRLKDRVLES